MNLIILLTAIPTVVCSSQLFPFGPSHSDNTVPVDSYTCERIKTKTKFPFFGFKHSYLWVRPNGVLTFDNSTVPVKPYPFPNTTIKGIIAPFWVDMRTLGVNNGKVYYRKSTNKYLLHRASKVIRRYDSSQNSFSASWLFIATWNNMTCFGCDKRLRNTYQSVLVSDGNHSFLIFNYEKIGWTVGENVNDVPAQVGFDSGDGKHFFEHPNSRTRKLLSIANESNVNNPGEWVFKLFDSENTSAVCGDGWFYFHSSSGHEMCYKLYDNKLVNWHTAQIHCQYQGGTLAMIKSLEEKNFIFSHFDTSDFWVGGTDFYVQGKFKWLDGSDVNTSVIGFGPTQPDGGTTEDCLGSGTVTNNLLFDGNCNIDVHFSLCQAPPRMQKIEHETATSPTVPSYKKNKVSTTAEPQNNRESESTTHDFTSTGSSTETLTSTTATTSSESTYLKDVCCSGHGTLSCKCKPGYYGAKCQHKTASNVRLIDARGMENVNYGRLEVNLNGKWGAVCNKHYYSVNFYERDMAKVICHLLGHKNTSLARFYYSHGGFMSETAKGKFRYEVRCKGHEVDIEQCTWTALDHSNMKKCHHNNDVEISCVGYIGDSCRRPIKEGAGEVLSISKQALCQPYGKCYNTPTGAYCVCFGEGSYSVCDEYRRKKQSVTKVEI